MDEEEFEAELVERKGDRIRDKGREKIKRRTESVFSLIAIEKRFELKNVRLLGVVNDGSDSRRPFLSFFSLLLLFLKDLHQKTRFSLPLCLCRFGRDQQRRGRRGRRRRRGKGRGRRRGFGEPEGKGEGRGKGIADDVEGRGEERVGI